MLTDFELCVAVGIANGGLITKPKTYNGIITFFFFVFRTTAARVLLSSASGDRNCLWQ
jgi:hypothetical protein